jgi:uncharacterized protein (DUF302 family)
METDCRYGFGCNLGADYETTLARVESLLAEHGFKVYTRLKLHEIICRTGKEAFGRYIIIGACNTDFACSLFSADPDIGLLMPCNIIVYELKAGGCRVMVKDPIRIMDAISSPAAIDAAIQVKEELEQLVEELAG